MQVYQLFLVAAASILISGQTFVAAADSTQATISGATVHIQPATVQTDGRRFLRATAEVPDDEERGLVADSLRKASAWFEQKGWTKTADTLLLQAWKSERLSTAQAAKEASLMTSPGLMSNRGMDLYDTYAKMVESAKKAAQ